jgi:hypothetical protein
MCYLKVFKKNLGMGNVLPKKLCEKFGNGGVGPPFFLQCQPYPPWGLWGDRLWLDGRETQQIQGFALARARMN